MRHRDPGDGFAGSEWKSPKPGPSSPPALLPRALPLFLGVCQGAGRAEEPTGCLLAPAAALTGTGGAQCPRRPNNQKHAPEMQTLPLEPGKLAPRRGVDGEAGPDLTSRDAAPSVRLAEGALTCSRGPHPREQVAPSSQDPAKTPLISVPEGGSSGSCTSAFSSGFLAHSPMWPGHRLQGYMAPLHKT